MLAWWPGTIEPNSTCDLITSQIDLMPTIAEVGGLKETDFMDGISILPTLRGEPDQQTEREYLYWEYHTRGGQQAVRLGKWKAYRVGGPGAAIEIYDIENDPGEDENLAAKNAELVTRVEQIMEKEHSEHPKYKFKLAQDASPGEQESPSGDSAKGKIKMSKEEKAQKQKDKDVNRKAKAIKLKAKNEKQRLKSGSDKSEGDSQS